MSRIFVVDDHAIVRDGLRAMLDSGGHEVVGEAADPTAALAGLLRLTPDVLLLDLQLEERSGLELLAEIRQRRLSVRTVVLTMSLQPRDVADAVRLGALGYVLKESPRAELLRAIEAVAGGRRFVGNEVAELAMRRFEADAPADLLAALSPRERQIITLVVRGQTSQYIGEQLHLSSKTVDTYRSRLMTKIGVADLTALVRFAIRAGLIDASEP